MRVLVTGSAELSGSALTIRFLERGDTVIGIDKRNAYYSFALKETKIARQLNHTNSSHQGFSLEKLKRLSRSFKEYIPQYDVKLASKTGIKYTQKYSLADNDTNVLGFGALLEGCRRNLAGCLFQGLFRFGYDQINQSESINAAVIRQIN